MPAAGRLADSPKPDSKRWDVLMQAIEDIALITESCNVFTVLHTHSGAWFDFEDEVDAARKFLPADLAGPCLDSGHFICAGMDPVAKCIEYADMAPFMHFKDVDATVLRPLLHLLSYNLDS